MEDNDRIYRSSLRGLRKCPSCGCYNGNRSKGCNNKCCSLFVVKATQRKHSMDPVQLVSHKDTKIYSVQVKEKDPLQRNFVQITDITLSADKDGSIVSRNAICYVDTCKYDSRDVSISCKHVKGASECTRRATELKVAEDVLCNMKISPELKSGLWDSYVVNKSLVPAVQRISRTTFVVECNPSLTFPAGRLHVVVAPDDEAQFNYTCACKKLRILLSPNNSVEIENDVCDHLIFLLAGVLSSPHLQEQFRNFINALSSFWVRNHFVFDNGFLSNEDFASFSESILNSVVEYNPEGSLGEGDILHTDPSMTSNAEGPKPESVILPLPTEDCSNQYTECLELTDCQIELMDQFKLTNQIDLCNDEIQMCEDELFEDNHLQSAMSNAVADVFMTHPAQVPAPEQTETRVKKLKRTEKPKVQAVVQLDEGIPTSPLLEFNSWLTFVIEEINESIEFDLSKTEVKVTFKIKNDFFIYLSEKFAVGEKRRIPNRTTEIKRGKHKGLMKSTWIFTTPSSIKRIFCSDKLSIKIEKHFVEKSPGNFIPYNCDISPELRSNPKERKILPIMYSAFINLGAKHKEQRKGFVVDWMPNAFPQSRFGILTIAFIIGFKKNNKVIEVVPI